MAVVVRTIARADKAVAGAFAEFGVATAHEAQGRRGLLAPYLNPVYPGAQISGTAVTVSDAHSNQHPTKLHDGHVSAPQLAQKIRAFEAKGYVPTSCTVSGTLMRNYSTGQSVTVEW